MATQHAFMQENFNNIYFFAEIYFLSRNLVKQHDALISVNEKIHLNFKFITDKSADKDANIFISEYEPPTCNNSKKDTR